MRVNTSEYFRGRSKFTFASLIYKLGGRERPSVGVLLTFSNNIDNPRASVPSFKILGFTFYKSLPNSFPKFLYDLPQQCSPAIVQQNNMGLN